MVNLKVRKQVQKILGSREGLDTMTTSTQVDQFLHRCNTTDLDSCWIWRTASMVFQGLSSYRVSWRIFRGDPTGLWVRRCSHDHRCVNPLHLRVMTAPETIAENVVKAKSLGKKIGRPKAPYTYNELRTLHFGPAKLTPEALAERFNADIDVVKGILNSTWRRRRV